MKLCVSRLCLERNSCRILKEVDFTVCAGRRVAILGENGSGKSSLLHHLADAEPYTLNARGGDIQWSEPSLSLAQLARVRSLCRQQVEAAPGLTVREVLRLSIDSGQPLVPMEQVLEFWGLSALASRLTENLSGGERQRLELARTWWQIHAWGDGGVWLLDEPVNMLDMRYQQRLWLSLREHCHNGGAVLFSVHDINAALRHADDVLLLGAGRQLAFGPVATVLNAKNAEKTFGVPFVEHTMELPPFRWLSAVSEIENGIDR